MTHYIKILPIAILLTLFSCTTDENQDITYGADGANITINTYISQSRNSAKTKFTVGDHLGLYACATTGDYAGSFSGNLMNNVDVTYGESGWYYSPLVGWPADANQHVSFVAVYPRVNINIPLRYAHTVASDVNNQVDELWCTVRDASINDRNGKAINGDEDLAAFEPSSGDLTLRFRHMLSKIGMKVKLDVPYPGITAKLKRLRVTNAIISGYFDINPNLSDVAWTTSNSRSSFTVFDETEEPKVLSNEAVSLPDAFLIPQSGAKIEMVYSHTLIDGTEEKTLTKVIDIPGEWEIDKAYNYTINLSLDVNTITVDVESVADWDNDSAPVMGSSLVEPVDLGLSIKWAPFDYGTASYKTSSLKLYNFDQSKTVAITQAWGSGWFIPKWDNWRELFDNCSITKENGIYKATSKINGNTIYLTNRYYWTEYDQSDGKGGRQYYYIDLEHTPNKWYYRSTKTETYPVRPVYK